jgi:hypothetical protein
MAQGLCASPDSTQASGSGKRKRIKSFSKRVSHFETHQVDPSKRQANLHEDNGEHAREEAKGDDHAAGDKDNLLAGRLFCFVLVLCVAGWRQWR